MSGYDAAENVCLEFQDWNTSVTLNCSQWLLCDTKQVVWENVPDTSVAAWVSALLIFLL